MPKYIGLTIGPIYDTIVKAKKIKEIWLASYVFSYLMKKIVENFQGYEILIPISHDNSQNEQKTGNFPDRFIFKPENDNDFKKLKDITESVLKELEDKYSNNNLRNYFQIYFLEKEFNAVKYSDVVNEIYKYLDSFDNMKRFSDKSIDILKIILPEDKDKQFLFEEAGYNGREKKFPMLFEIAAAEYKTFFKDSIERGKNFDDDDKFYIKLQEYLNEEIKSKLLKPYKYIAVVTLDGDNFSEKLKKMENDEYNKFSKTVSKFSNYADKEIVKYGGLPIYASGDEALFVAPVINMNESMSAKNIFQFIEKIKNNFQNIFQEKYKDVSISFGVNISYYKFPIGESIKHSYEQLEKAKKKKDKNSVAFKLMKHSGQIAESIFKFDSEEYKEFLKIIDDRADLNLLSSILFKTENFDAFLKSIVTEENLSKNFENIELKINNFFINFFNEDIHNKNRHIIENIKDFLLKIMKSQNVDLENKFFSFYSSMRTVKFLRESINE